MEVQVPGMFGQDMQPGLLPKATRTALVRSQCCLSFQLAYGILPE